MTKMEENNHPETLQEAAERSWEQTNRDYKPVNPPAYVLGFKDGATHQAQITRSEVLGEVERVIERLIVEKSSSIGQVSWNNALNEALTQIKNLQK